MATQQTTTLRRISQQQMKTGKEIVETYTETQVRYVVLTAQMQSGKTTTYYFVAAEMFRLQKIKHIIIFSGNAEKELRDQVQTSFNNQFIRFYERYLAEFLGMNDDSIDDLIDEIRQHHTIIWGGELNKFRNDYVDTIIVWEESHFAQNSGMRPDKFLIAAGIPVNGEALTLESRNNYFLSVSATPFSEVSDIKHLDQFKRIVRLEPGEGYYSVEQMLLNNLIIGFDDWKLCLRDVLSQRAETPKFALLRLRDNNAGSQQLEVQQIAERFGWKVKLYDSSPESDIKLLTHELRIAPTQNTIIILKGMCRMGKEVNKTHMSFVMETSAFSKTDVVLQGLMGRMCGYHNCHNIRIFLNNRIIKDDADELRRYVMWTKGDSIIPTKATNLKTVKVTRVKPGSLNPIIPIKISKQNLRIDGSDDVEPSDENKEYIKESVKAAFLRNSVENYNCEEQTTEILAQVDAFDLNKFDVRIVGKRGNKVEPKTRAPALPKIHEFFTTKTAGKLGSSNGINAAGGIIVIWWFSAAFVEYGISNGDIFIDARTVSKDTVTNANTRMTAQLIPTTTRKEVFCRKLETGETVVNNGSYTISLVPETMNNIDVMLHSLSELIENSLHASEVLVKPRKITSNQIGDTKWQGILVNEQVYNGFNKSGCIYKAIKAKFGVEIKILKKRGARPQELAVTDVIRLAEISW
jgi:hypothetical protein